MQATLCHMISYTFIELLSSLTDSYHLRPATGAIIGYWQILRLSARNIDCLKCKKLFVKNIAIAYGNYSQGIKIYKE